MNSQPIPHQIEELLWAAAESRNAETQAEFERRYPQYRAALATRKAMLDVLRENRPLVARPPVFSAPRERTSRLWLVPATAVLLAALAFGAYKLTSSLSTPAPAEPDAARQMPTPQPLPPDGGPGKPLVLPGPGSDVGTAPHPGQPASAPVVVLKVEGATLAKALDAIQGMGKTQLQVMPGVQDAPLALQANRPDGSFAMAPGELLQLLETLASVRVVDNGPEGFLVLPLDKVTNTDS